MTVREDMNIRRDEFNRVGNYFMADLISNSFQLMSENLLDKEIEDELIPQLENGSKENQE